MAIQGLCVSIECSTNEYETAPSCKNIQKLDSMLDNAVKVAIPALSTSASKANKLKTEKGHTVYTPLAEQCVLECIFLLAAPAEHM